MKNNLDSEIDNKQIQQIKERIEDLKKRWPAHSVPPILMQELDDLEEELADALEKARQEKTNA